MRSNVQSLRARARIQAAELLEAIETAESIVVGTIERECEAIRAGRMLAATALHIRLNDAAKLYLNAARAAHASLQTIEQVLPGASTLMQERRAAFAALLKVELAVLAVERAALQEAASVDSADSPPNAEAASAPKTERPSQPNIRLVADADSSPRALTPYRPRRRKAG